MNKKYIYFILVNLFFCLCGSLCGYFWWHQRHYCLDFQVKDSPFYTVFTQKLQSRMEKLGYSFTCPAFFPRTTLYFIGTQKNVLEDTRPETGLFRTNIAVLGDCSEKLSFEFLDEYHLLLLIHPYHSEYFSQLNFRTAFLPMVADEWRTTFCNTDFYQHSINLSRYANWLDKIIQGALNEKF